MKIHSISAPRRVGAAGLLASLLLGGCNCQGGAESLPPPPEGWLWMTDTGLGVRAAFPNAPMREVHDGTEALASGEVAVTLVAYRAGIDRKSLEITGVIYPEGTIEQVGAETLYKGMRDTLIAQTSATLVSEEAWTLQGHQGWASSLTTVGAGVLELRTWVDGDRLLQASFMGRASPTAEEFFASVASIDSVSQQIVTLADGRLVAVCPGPCAAYTQSSPVLTGDEKAEGVQGVLDGVHFGVSVMPVSLGPVPPDAEAGLEAVRDGLLTQWKVVEHEEEDDPIGRVDALRLHFVTEQEVSVDFRVAVVDGLLVNAAVLAPVGLEPHWGDIFLGSLSWKSE